MSTFHIDITQTECAVSEFMEIKNKVDNISGAVRGQADLGILAHIDRYGMVRKNLYDISDSISVMGTYLGNCKNAVSQICSTYSRTENTLTGVDAQFNDLRSESGNSVTSVSTQNTELTPGEIVEEGLREDLGLELGLGTIGQVLESSTYGVDLFARTFSAGYMPGAMGFAMYHPGSWQQLTASGLAKVCPIISKFGKVGIPVLGGLIDFGAQLIGGEGAAHAGLKAAAHTGVGVAVGTISTKAGAAVGGAIGSIIPGAGTVVGAAVGAVVGMAVGCVVTVAVNSLLDAGYDKYVRKSVDRFTEGVKSFFAPAGRVLGTIFG